MATVLIFANWLLPLAYLALVIDYGATFILRVRTNARNPGLALAILLHAAFLAAWGLHAGAVPLGTIYEILSLVALSSAALYAVMELLCRDRRAGVFVLMLIFLIQYTASMEMAAPLAAGGKPAAESALGRLHFIPAAFAYTAIAFAAVYALLYLVGQRNLKRHSFGLLFDRLPPLDLLGTMSSHAMAVGFLFMTVTIVTGAVWAKHMPAAAHSDAFDLKLAAKIVTGSIAWVTCLVALVGKYLGKWSVQRVCQFTLAGFLIILVLFVASLVLSA